MFVNINGLNIHYLDMGGEKPVLLLLHGWGCSGGTFGGLAALSDSFRLVSPDLPGFGLSHEPHEAWGVGEYAGFIKAFCDETGISPQVIFAHSLGCRIAIKLLSQNALSPEKVIFTGAAGIKPRKTAPQKLKTAFFKVGKIFIKPFPKLLEKLQSRSGSADYRAASPMMRKCLVKIVNEDLTPLLPQVRQSVLLIWGENDDSTPLSDGRLMEREMPDAGLAVIQNAGHYAFLDQPERFMKIVNSYLGVKND